MNTKDLIVLAIASGEKRRVWGGRIFACPASYWRPQLIHAGAQKDFIEKLN
jgi:hypothetical protein